MCAFKLTILHLKAVDGSFEYIGEWKSGTNEVSFGVFKSHGRVCWEGSVKHIVKGYAFF